MFLKKNKKLRKRMFYDRSSAIPDCFYLSFIRVHKGRKHRNLFIESFFVGKKFGEFSFTRKPFYFPAKKSKKKNMIIRR